ncbi:MAG: nucleotidyl transferase AbiEii/AbiGii toxin family protein [Deltaproteobacteria bacterium]|nr:nucleotidyl transferase AbiEii/AbiGii toxin family protein [Deltaproteobacteria bacterium]
MIPQRNLSLLSNRLARAGGRRIVEAVLERDYCLAWFLVGLSRAPLREALVFKGGTALKHCYFGDYRFSEDLEFTLAGPREPEAILAGLEAVYAEVQRASGIVVRFARADRKSHQNSHTFYLSYEGPLPAASPKEVKVDITIREQRVRPVEERPVLRGYEEYADLPEDAPVRVYALEEIAVEKLVALTDKARNEPRDLYDLWYLTSEGLTDFSTLIPELEAKLAFRGRTRDAMTAELATKEARYRKLWAVRLGQQTATLPPFDDVFRAVRRSLHHAGLVER